VATEVKLPRLGQGMEAGTITKWLKAEGDQVKKGDPLYEVDTDKVTQEVEAEATGVLIKIAVGEGEVEVGRTIAFIGEPGEQVSEPSTNGPPPKEEAAAEKEPEPTREGEAPAGEAEVPTEEEQATDEETAPGRSAAAAPSDGGGAKPVREAGERIKASPLARRIGRERGIDLALVSGTGPEGRIVAEDVERFAAAPAPAPTVAAPTTAPAEIEVRPLTNVRRTIARRLTEAWTVPVFQLVVSADMTKVNELVARRRELDSDVRVTVTDVLAKVCAASLMRHREVNVQYTDDGLNVFPTANVGIAVAAPQGLVVPVIAGVERLSLREIAAARSDVVARARDNKLKAGDLEGGTFTISNLGMFGVEQFTAILNPPQAAILAVGATEDRPVAENGEIVVRPMMSVTLTVDHRAVDGAPAAEFLQTVKASLEDPTLAL
jgi:pyruvate dehydrogenase E2 component (dihydrolipoyllysine-residue acetyltransferase)